MSMPRRPYGDTGLDVSVLGLGGGVLGRDDVSDADAAALLHLAVELGITLFDTARAYGASEERIGRHLARYRDRVIYSTKVGYGVDGIPDWTGPCVTAGVEQAMARLKTDYIDIVHLHSCPRDVLERGEVVVALESAVRAGKVRVAAYSGDNDALRWAADSGRFGGLQTSVSICDQWSLDRVVPAAARRGIGVIAKRPLANAFWRFDQRPHGDYAETYWQRWQQMSGALDSIDPAAAALRFTAHAPGVCACIVGTANPAHLRRNAALVERGPLPPESSRALARAFCADWPGEI